MKKFKLITCADHPGLPEWVYPELQKYSEGPIKRVYNYPNSDKEIIENINNADCSLVSWNTLINSKVIAQSKNLKYIGMCCSLIDENSANVDVPFARKNGITVKGVRDYGDEGVIEFILSELIRLLKGTGRYQWKEDQVELGNQKIGIIGMGTTGTMLARAALFFKMNVFYFSRNRKPEMEKLGCTYLPLDELLSTVDILSLHLPKNNELLQKEHFAQLGNWKILINTTLGLSFNKPAFISWMKHPNNYAIMDESGMGTHSKEFQEMDRFISTSKTSGFTYEAKNRLGQKVIENIQSYLKENEQI